MFARKLIDTPELTMSIDWLGAGRLEVTHWPTKRYASATREMKSYFLQACESLQSRGVAMVPNNPVMERVFVFFAEAMLNPDGLRVRAALAQHPHDFAAGILAELVE